jgi:uncharacterized protein YaiI (UPF0178 family)
VLDLFVDIESCPVYPQMLRLARRHSLDLYVVTRDYLETDTNVHLIFAQEGGAGACEWISANIRPGDICVTDDGKLASSCTQRGALALAPSGRAWPGETVSTGGIREIRKTCAEDSRAFAQHLEAVIAAVRLANWPPASRPGRLIRAGYAGGLLNLR